MGQVEKSELMEFIEALVIAVALGLFIVIFIVQSFLVQGQSMEQTLTDGQRLFVDKLTYRFRDPQRGEIVVFKYPSNPSRKFIKRVIGIPGDVVAIRDNVLYLNGVPLEEDYIIGPTRGMYGAPTFGPQTVPEGCYFVLGDNRTNSDDSRYPDVGMVKRELIVGRAIISYWPPSRLGLIRIPEIFKEMEEKQQ